MLLPFRSLQLFARAARGELLVSGNRCRKRGEREKGKKRARRCGKKRGSSIGRAGAEGARGDARTHRRRTSVWSTSGMSCSYPLHLPPRPRAPSRTRPLSTECARNRNDFRGARTTAGHGRASRPLEPVFPGRAIAPGRSPARCVPIDPTDRRGSTPSGLVRVAAPAALSASPEGVHRLSSSHVRQSGDAASAIFFLPGRDAGASSSATGPSAPGPAHRSRSHPARGSIATRVPRPFTGPARRAVAARGLCERPTRRPRASLFPIRRNPKCARCDVKTASRSSQKAPRFPARTGLF